METREFKRSSYLTLTPKTTKAGVAGSIRKRKDINVVGEVLALRSASGKLMRDLEPFISPGVQLNDILRGKAKENLGELLQHSVTLAKLLKVKTPASAKKIKARTQTLLLMEIDRTCGEIFDTYVSAVRGAKVVPMTEEEKAAALAKYNEAEAKRKAKWEQAPATTKNAEGQDVPKGEYKPGKAPDFTKIEAAAINEAALKGQLEHLLRLAYEFNWAMFDAPVADTMAARIDRIKGNYPAGFFTPPPKKAPPAGLKPGQKREKKTVDAAVVVASQPTPAPAAEAAKA